MELRRFATEKNSQSVDFLELGAVLYYCGHWSLRHINRVRHYSSSMYSSEIDMEGQRADFYPSFFSEFLSSSSHCTILAGDHDDSRVSKRY